MVDARQLIFLARIDEKAHFEVAVYLFPHFYYFTKRYCRFLSLLRYASSGSVK